MSQILEDPITFGIEFEPGYMLQYFLTKEEEEAHYDRESIYKVGKLNTTLETFHGQQGSCSYNIELVLGVYEVPKLRNFLMDKTFYTEEIKTDLGLFQTEFIEQHRDRLMSLFRNKVGYIPDGLVGGLFKDCGRTEEATEHSKQVYAKYYINKDIIPIQGVPQVTIGTSYAFFLPILYETGDKDLELFSAILSNLMEKVNLTGMSREEAMVIEGFFATLLYSCVKHYSSQLVRHPYFKAAFTLKPRSNPASSYRQLLLHYPNVRESMEELYQTLPHLDSSVNSYDDLAAYKNEYIRVVYKKGVSGTVSEHQKYNYLIKALSSDLNLVFDMICFDLKYFLNQIINPRRIIQIKKLNAEYIDKGSPIMENYFYRYTQKDEQKLSGHPAIVDYRVLLEGYAGLGDLPILQLTEEGKLSTNARLEIFEWIADNPSLIFELRAAEQFVGEEYLDTVTIDNLDVFVKDCLTKIVRIMKVVLTRNGILEKPKRVVSSVSSLLLQ